MRIEAINRLSAVDPVAAEPVLREIITGCDHACLSSPPSTGAAKHRMFGLLDCVDEAQGDHRPLVAKLAQDVYRRLAKAARKTTSTDDSPRRRVSAPRGEQPPIGGLAIESRLSETTGGY